MLNLSPSGHLSLCLFVLLLVPTFQSATAQQSLRPSLSSPTDKSRPTYPETGYDYNLELGPVFLKLGTSFGVEYNDNINLASSESTTQIIPGTPAQTITVLREPAQPARRPQLLPSGVIIPGRPAIPAQTERVTIPGTPQTVREISGPGPLSDLIYRPAVTIHATWPTTKLNVISFDLGLGLERHLNNPEYDQTNITITPNTQLSYDVYLGNVRLNFHDQISISQNPSARNDTVNTGPYSQFNNTIGVNALYDLNVTILQVGYDYGTYRYTGNNYDQDNSNSQTLNGALAFPLSAAITVGLQGNYVLTSYLEPTRPKITTLGYGPFAQIKPSRYTSIQASGGYQKSSYEYPADSLFTFLGLNANPAGSIYYNLDFTNQLNRYFQHELVVGRERQLGLNTETYDVQYVRYGLQWIMNSRLVGNGYASYQHGTQENLTSTEHFDYVGWGLSLRYQLTRQLSAACHYGRVQRTSDLILNSYQQNTIGFDLRYDF